MRTNQDQSLTRADRPLDPYTDPIGFLKAFGIAAELVETKEDDLPSAA